MTDYIKKEDAIEAVLHARYDRREQRRVLEELPVLNVPDDKSDEE